MKKKNNLFNENRKIEKDILKDRLIESIKLVTKLTKKYVLNKIPEEVLLNLYVISDVRDGEKLLRLNIDETIDKLCINNKLPTWVDIRIVKIDNNTTIISADYNKENYTNDEKLFYDFDKEFPPFKVCGPITPPNWESLEKSGKFNLVEFDEEEGWPKKK